MMFNRTPIAPLEYTRKLWMRSWVGLTMLFLYAPLIVLMVFSFNDSKRNVVWKGFTLKYYEKALNNDSLVEALVNSLTIAALATIVSLVIGALAAVALWRFRFPFKGLVEGTMSLPIIVPEICLGVAFLIFFAKVDWPTDLPWPLNLRGRGRKGPWRDGMAGVSRCPAAAHTACVGGGGAFGFHA
jgi:spermidine/putrescine transport system permease protein